MAVRPPIHRPVGRREKRERDQDYARRRNPEARALYRSNRWRTERAALFATDPPYLVDYDGTNHPTKKKASKRTKKIANKDWSEDYIEQPWNAKQYSLLMSMAGMVSLLSWLE